MSIRWSPQAAADFAGIIDYIQQQNPSTAVFSAIPTPEQVAEELGVALDFGWCRASALR